MNQSFVIFADGGSRGNPGPAASGFVIYELDILNKAIEEIFQEIEISQPKIQKGYYLGQKTNNQAEWQALLLSIESLKEKTKPEDSSLLILLDSELVVKQVKREYKVKNPDLKILYQKFIEQIKAFKDYKIQHIYRKFNKKADAMVNQSLDLKENLDFSV